jgi:hypothetical protein
MRKKMMDALKQSNSPRLQKIRINLIREKKNAERDRQEWEKFLFDPVVYHH